MAAAWSRKGVRVNAIACGAVRAATLMDEAEKLASTRATLAMSNGVGRLGEPDEIGYGVLSSPLMRRASVRGKRCTCTAAPAGRV